MRTITDIKKELTDAFMANENLQKAYGFAPGTAFDKQFSRVSLESLLLYIVAFAQWTLEKLFDTHTQEVEEYISTMKPHTLRWYVEKSKAFLYGLPLVDGTDTYNTKGYTDDQLAIKRIISFAACTEHNATLYLKVAKEGPEPLSDEEKSAFVAYLHEIKDAGVRIDVISKESDYLKLNMVIYYNPLLINSNGESKADGTKVVEVAIKNYIENIPFNGEFRKNELVDAIQLVEGVVMVEFVSAEHSETGAAGSYLEVVPFCKPTSGYFKFSNADIENVTYQPYVY